MFDIILCQRDYNEIKALKSELFEVQQWQSDQQLKDLIAQKKKILLITDKCEIRPDLFNLYHMPLETNCMFHHYCEEVVEGDGYFPGVQDLILCKDFYRDSGIFLVVNGDFGALPTFEKKVMPTVADYISFDQYQRAIFLDRDGIINIDHSYVHKIDDLEFVSGIKDFLSCSQAQSFQKFIVTNQSGVARGKFSLEDVRLFNDEIKRQLAEVGVDIKAVEVAPYHFEKGVGDFKWHSLTRKPYPGMVLKITHQFPVDLKNSWMIGDKPSDHLELDSLNYVHLRGNYDLALAKSPIAEDFDQLKNIVFCS